MKTQFGTSGRDGPLYFAYSVTEQRSPDLEAQFAAVKKRLDQLAETIDGNGQRVVQYVFTRIGEDEPHQVLAYRWTSDWAHRVHQNELVRLGGSLARGGWDPFDRPGGIPARLMLDPVKVPA